MTTAPRFLVLDTDVLLHCKPFDQLDWRELADGRDVVLLIVGQVLRELDKHKNSHPKPRVQERARKVLAHLVELVESDPEPEVRDGVRLRRFRAAPPPTLFDEHSLDRSVGDDYLVAEALVFQHRHPDADVCIVARDSGPRLTAGDVGLASRQPPPHFELKGERDPRDEELERLRWEVQRLQSLRPNLSIAFSGGLNHAAGRVRYMAELDEAAAAAAADEAVARIPGNTQLSRFGVYFGKALAEWEERRWRYRQDYLLYLRTLYAFECERQLRIDLPKLVLSSTGGVPAEHVSVALRFPSNVAVSVSDTNASAPLPPSRPVPPQPVSASGVVIGPFNYETYVPAYGPSKRQRLQDPRRTFDVTPAGFETRLDPVILPGKDGMTAVYSFDRIQQALSHELAALSVSFRLPEPPRSFGLRYRLAADGLEPIIGELHVKVSVDTPPAPFGIPALPLERPIRGEG